MSLVASRRHPLEDKKPFLKHFYPRDLAITAVRSVALQGLIVFNGYVATLEADESDESDEEDDEEEEEFDNEQRQDQKHRRTSASSSVVKADSDFEFPTYDEFSTNCARTFVKSLSVTTCLRSLESIVIRIRNERLIGKLIKDVGKSSARKFARSQSKWASALMMVKTGMYANVLSHVAIFIIEETQQVVLILYRRFMKWRKDKKNNTNKNNQRKCLEASNQDTAECKKEAQQFMALTTKNLTRCGLSVLTGGLGAAVGTLVRPGFGTIVGATLGDSIAYAL